MKIKKGDSVQVISGKDRGKTGVVQKILRESNRVVVEGINIVKRHRKSTTQDQPSGIFEVEAPIHVSNVMVLDPKDDKPTRVGYKVEKNKKQRIAKKSGNEIK